MKKKKIKKDYDCVGEVRKVRDELDALHARDPQAFIDLVNTGRERYFKSLGITPYLED